MSTHAAGGSPSRKARALRLGDLLAVRDQTDETGRLLLEDSAPREARKKAERMGVEMRSLTCPYGDTPSRYGGTMNESAYEALRRDMGEVLDGFAWLTARYLDTAPSRRGTVRLLVDVSRMGLTLPLVLFHRARDPYRPHGQLPSFVASIFKASRGLLTASVDLLNEKGASARVSGVDVVRFADERGHMVRAQTRRVCAAPTRLIERTIAVLLTGEGGDAEASRLAPILDFRLLWDFHRLEDSFSDACDRYRFVLERLTQQGVRARSPRELFGAVIQEGGSTWSFGDFTEAFLRHANGVQDELNRLLGRTGAAPPLRVEDIPRLL